MHWWDSLRARSAFGRLIRDIGEDITLTLFFDRLPLSRRCSVASRDKRSHR